MHPELDATKNLSPLVFQVASKFALCSLIIPICGRNYFPSGFHTITPLSADALINRSVAGCHDSAVITLKCSLRTVILFHLDISGEFFVSYIQISLLVGHNAIIEVSLFHAKH